MAGVGDYGRVAEMYGLSEDEVAKLNEGYAAGTTTTEGNDKSDPDKTTKYTEFTYEEQSKWDKEFQKADSLPAVERAADRMAQAGIDPQIVAQWYDYYAEKFIDEEQDAPKNPTKGIGGGGGGGVMYAEQR